MDELFSKTRLSGGLQAMGMIQDEAAERKNMAKEDRYTEEYMMATAAARCVTVMQQTYDDCTDQQEFKMNEIVV